MTTDTRTDRPTTEEAVGELRQQLRAAGWRSDLGWSDVGSGSAASAVRAAGEAEARRTIAYLASLRAVDGGASRVWMDGDVPAPRAADAREVMCASTDDSEWQSEIFEAPPERATELGGRDNDPVAAADAA